MSFPFSDAYQRASSVLQTLIQELRQKFLERAEKSSDQYYSDDIERAKTDDWTISRFLYHFNGEPDVNRALEALDKALKWRKSFGVMDINDTDFPQEVYKAAPVVFYGKDKNGSQVIVFRGKTVKKSSMIAELTQKFFVYHMEIVDRSNNGKGITIVWDSTDAGIKNMDLEFHRFWQQVLAEYYPGLLSAQLVYSMPMILEAIFKVIRSWMHDEQSKYMYFVDKDTIGKYLPEFHLNEQLKNKQGGAYRRVPEGAPTASQLADKYGWRKDKMDRLVKHWEKYYDN